MISNVLPLIKSLLQILLLRKGPEALPRAPVIVVIVVGLWLLSGVAILVTVEGYSSRKFLIDILLTAFGLVIYALLINAANRAARLQQALSAILGCGALLGLVLVSAESLLPRLLAAEQVQSVVTLIWLWSLPVEAHIIARTIDRQWYIGFFSALVVLFLQLFLLPSLASAIDPQGQQQAEVVTTEQA
jgi:hypothetical protein